MMLQNFLLEVYTVNGYMFEIANEGSNMLGLFNEPNKYSLEQNFTNIDELKKQ